MNITNENTDRYVDEMLTVFKDDTEAVDAIRAVYQKNKSVIKTDQINFCLERYVNSELDLTTDSTRDCFC